MIWSQRNIFKWLSQYICSFTYYLLGTYYVWNVSLGSKDTILTEQVYEQTLHWVYFLGVYILFKYLEA